MSHSGPVVIRFGRTHYSVLCPVGHLVTAGKLDTSWGGSYIEAKIVAHQSGAIPWTVDCDGTLLEEDPAMKATTISGRRFQRSATMHRRHAHQARLAGDTEMATHHMRMAEARDRQLKHVEESAARARDQRAAEAAIREAVAR